MNGKVRLIGQLLVDALLYRDAMQELAGPVPAWRMDALALAVREAELQVVALDADAEEVVR